MRQFRVVHLGVAAVLAAACVTATGLVRSASAAGSGGVASSLVPITPCRLVDTRPGSVDGGSRTIPLGPNETAIFQVTGTNGACSIPAAATGIVTNVTVVGPSAASYVTIFPADAGTRPTASNLNFVAGQPPTANQVTVGLSATGSIATYNLAGTVDLIVDVVGYYEASPVGGARPGSASSDPTCPATGCVSFFSGLDAANVDGSRLLTSDACLRLAGASGFALMPLDLPAGALIESMRVRYRSADARQFQNIQRRSPEARADNTGFRLYSMNETGGLVARSSVLQSVTTSSSAATGMISLSTGGVAQGRDSQYLLKIEIRGGGQEFCGAEVTYRFI
jgi:hypothetical protein